MVGTHILKKNNINHNNINNNKIDSVRKDQFINFRVLSIISSSIIKNHIMNTDSSIYINFPYLNINISDNLFSLYDLMEIIKF